MTRRAFASTLALAAPAAALLPSATRAAGAGASTAAPLLDARGQRIKLGMDNFAVRAMGWKGRDLVDYAASQRLDTLFITDLPAVGSNDLAPCAELRRYATDKGVEIILGSWSICPTSTRFKADWGTAEEHLALGIRMAKALGSPVFRVVLGAREDRLTPGGIEARIADTVKVLKSQRSLALDSGVRIAVENHAGDMTATELVSLVQAAGPDYVGVNLDSGNALWTLEDPLASLETLAPHVLATSLRDSAVWESPKGCKVQWTAFGEGGVVDLRQYFARFAQLCPGVAVNIETIGGFVVELPYLEPDFWKGFPHKPAAEFARFLALARRGRAIATHDPNNKDLQRGELERSIRYLREEIGLGAKA